MTAKITWAVLLLYSLACLGQSGHRTLLDTADTAFRDNLKVFYAQNSLHTSASIKNLPNKRVAKSASESYQELNASFLEKINNGSFVPSPFYEERINGLFQKIVESNRQFSGLASTRILLSLSDQPNAFTIGDGIVVVNLPLLYNLKTEYELAFVICHELAHGILNHPFNGIVENATIAGSDELKQQTRDLSKKKYNKTESAAGLYRKIIYSNRKKNREVEFEADSLGFILYRNAFPGKESLAVKSFATLDGLDRETDSLVAKDYEKLFSSQKQPFKQEWLQADEISMYKYDKTSKFWQIDSLKTHPDCANRAERIKTFFKIDNKDYDPSPDYGNMSKNARYDQVLGLYQIKEFGKSLYQALLLLKDDEKDAYLRQMVYLNLTKIREAQKSYTLNRYVETISPGYSYSYNTFLSFLRQLRKSEMNEIINFYSTPI